MKQVALLDICLSDYFTGYHLPVIQIPLYGEKISNAQLSSMIMEEYNSIYDYINPDESKEVDKLYEDFCLQLNEKGGEIFWDGDPDYSEDDSDFYEPAYAYFSIINPVYRHGMMFLNE